MTRLRTLLPLVVIPALVACAEPEIERPMGEDAIAIGDSVLEWNLEEGASIPEVFAEQSGLAITHAAISGTRVLGGEDSIPSQYVSGEWQVVLIDGGANDVGPDGCGCGDCVEVVDELVSEDLATGAMVELVDRVLADSAEVILLGYYRPAADSEFGACDEELVAVNTRYAALAAAREGVTFVDMGEAIDYPSDPSDFSEDGIHPSVAGSRAVGEYIATQWP